MKFVTLAFSALVLFAACSGQNTPTRNIAFVSKKASEAILTFAHSVEMESASKPSLAEAKGQVEDQVQHLFGPMERSEVMAAPKEDQEIEIRASDIEKISDGLWNIHYRYTGTLVLQNGPRTKYKFPLPVNPDKIYQAAFQGSRNPCTDDHYQGESDFWYFWSPASWGRNDYPQCKLRSNENGRVESGEDYEVITGNVERLEKDRTTYPEYDRLAVNNVIDVHFFYGKDEPSGTGDPYKSTDANANAYREVVKSLTDKQSGLGFTLRRWSREEIDKILPRERSDSFIFVEEAEKNYPSGLKIRARIFFGRTGIGEKSSGFHYFLRDALKNASVMIYNGHSGLGSHLDLKSIASLHGFRLSPDKNRYQIYFFNSCTSYTYYNTTYFNRKRKKGKAKIEDPSGTKNLDIMANGVSTAFDVMHDTDMAVIRVIDRFATRNVWTSYQKIARDIDSDNLFTVNGDEDNPTSPRR